MTLGGMPKIGREGHKVIQKNRYQESVRKHAYPSQVFGIRNKSNLPLALIEIPFLDGI